MNICYINKYTSYYIISINIYLLPIFQTVIIQIKNNKFKQLKIMKTDTHHHNNNTLPQLIYNKIINQLQKQQQQLQQQQSTQYITLFNKLQKYDKIISSMHINKYDADRLFQIIITEQGNHAINNNNSIKKDIKHINHINHNYQQYNIGQFNSPPRKFHNNNKQQYLMQQTVQDPEQFSFSKPRANVRGINNDNQMHHCNSYKVQNYRNQQKVEKYFNNYSEKIAAVNHMYSNRHVNKKQRGNIRRISQFKEVDQPNKTINNNNSQQISIHNRSIILKTMLKRTTLNYLFKTMNKQIHNKKQSLKNKSVKYFHHDKLIHKGYYSLKFYSAYVKDASNKLKQKKKEKMIKQYFQEWKQYAYRSQQQRYIESIQQKKTVYLHKFIYLHRFITKSSFRFQNNINSNPSIALSIKNKSQYLHKKLTIRKLIYNSHQKQQYNRKFIALRKYIRQQQGMMFIKVIKCYCQLVRKEEEDIEKIVRKRVGGLRLIKKLKEQYYFQKGYWQEGDNGKVFMGFETTSQLPLNTINFHNHNKYSKILFINMFITFSQQSLYRKGYLFQPNYFSSSPEYISHPAVSNYLNKHTLHKYFTALKNQVQSNKNKSHTIKYQIKGRNSLIQPLLTWYKHNIKNRLQFQYIKLKQIQLKQYLFQNNSYKFLTKIKKYQQNNINKFIQKQEQVCQIINQRRIKSTLQILSSYKTTRKYYLKNIKQFIMRNRQKLQERTFLEWKLICYKKMHIKYLMVSVREMRKMKYFGEMYENVCEEKIKRRIMQKRMNWIIKNRVRKFGEQMLIKMYYQKKINYANCQIVNGSDNNDDNNKSQKVKLLIHKRNIQVFFKNLQLYHRIVSQSKQIYKISMKNYYEKNLCFKALKCLEKMVEVNKLQKIKCDKIAKKNKINQKKRCMAVMIDGLLRKLILRGLCKVGESYLKKIVIYQLKLEQEKQNVQKQEVEDEDEDEVDDGDNNEVIQRMQMTLQELNQQT